MLNCMREKYRGSQGADDHEHDAGKHVRSGTCMALRETAVQLRGEEHRTDSLSAAFNNPAEAQELTRRYEKPVPALRHARQP
jgi:hypothetical protein